LIRDNLIILRKSIGISQRELGRRIDMSGQYIAKIERDERNPTLETLKKIASELGVELSEILERPKLTGEIFLDKVNEKGISHTELMTQSKLNDSTLKSIFLNTHHTTDHSLNDYYSVGIYLGFQKKFLERRQNIDSDIFEFSISDEFECLSSISVSYDLWANNYYEDYHFDFSKSVKRTEKFSSENKSEEIKSKYSKIDNFSLDDINNHLRSTLLDLLRFANTSNILNYGLDDFSPDEVNELNNFIFNSYRLKINEILERHKTSN
jgi:transcriptional regulator with XRE-family HTH domain